LNAKERLPAMSTTMQKNAVRVLPEVVANKIAAGEVVERPASVVKELVENALDAGATRIIVRLVAAGRRVIEVIDDGHGMSQQDAVLAIERHATSKIRTADDLEAVRTMGFRGEALPSIASVSRFELLTRRPGDDEGTRIRIEGGVLRDVSSAPAPVGTRITVNRLYFNTPVRAKFLKGVTTELGQCIDVVQRHALAREGVAFQCTHNDKTLLDIPAHASLRERIALIWGLTFLNDMVDIEGERGGFSFRGYIGTPRLTRSQRTHQFFFLNGRPVVNRSLQYGFEAGYQELLHGSRRPVGIVMVEIHPRFVDVNVHPSKREARFRDEHAARNAIRELVRERLTRLTRSEAPLDAARAPYPAPEPSGEGASVGGTAIPYYEGASPLPGTTPADAEGSNPAGVTAHPPGTESPPAPASTQPRGPHIDDDPAFFERNRPPEQTELAGIGGPPREPHRGPGLEPVYRAMDWQGEPSMQVFDTYLMLPAGDRILIIDQHALHERLNYDNLMADLEDSGYESQQLAVPIVFEVAPSQTRILEKKLDVFRKVGIEIEPFGGNTFQVTAICHLYDDARVTEAIFAILDSLAQGDLFSREDFMSDMLRLATRACHASIRGGDRLSPEERQALIEGFNRLTPPYTCPHGRPIVTELTLSQLEKSFKRTG